MFHFPCKYYANRNEPHDSSDSTDNTGWYYKNYTMGWKEGRLKKIANKEYTSTENIIAMIESVFGTL